MIAHVPVHAFVSPLWLCVICALKFDVSLPDDVDFWLTVAKLPVGG